MLSSDVDRKIELPKAVSEVRNKVIKLSKFIHSHPELGSEELQCSKKLVDSFKEEGFEVTENFMNMKTSFMAKWGSGKPVVMMFAEYDALPIIGHGCGHNLIGAWAFGTATALKNSNFKGTVMVIGAPAEEGHGPYGSSKALMAPKLKGLSIDAVFTMHPRFEWEVGGPSLSISRHSFLFKGLASHAAVAPESGKNALDAAVLFYLSFRMLRTMVKRDKDVILSAIVKNGGSAPNVIPGEAEIWADVRTTDADYLEQLNEIVTSKASAIAASEGCEIEHKLVNPTLQSKKRWPKLEEYVFRNAVKYVPETVSPSVKWSQIGRRGSTDVGNVSQILPTVHLGIKICDYGTPSHTVEWAGKAGKDYAYESMITGVAIARDAILEYANSFKEKQKEEK